MMVKPCAKAIATIPGRPTPSPTTAAAPAPMNTKAKVPMNSARSLGAIRLDIVDLQSERVGDCPVVWGWTAAREGRPPAPKRAALLRGDSLRLEIDAQRLRDAGAVSGIGPEAVDDLPLDDLDRNTFHRRLVVIAE